ncbi:MAG: cyclic lactone autoinducer peptide [Syntrophomonadaceae bacterium]|nr:cyclic lactone autoinducer peptide [Syntrophomonadaceae bacterium]
MLTKLRTLACTSLASLLGLVALGNIGPCCPLLIYQPELPQKDQ